MQRVNLFDILESDRISRPPVVLRVVTHPSNGSMVEGVPATTAVNEQYVLLSALPDEIRQRVVTAVQALFAGR